jgi:adenine-specific DNA-methyltransferase
MRSQILIGDCLDVLRSLERESVNLVVTDPPYNIGIDYGFGKKADRRGDYWAWCRKWIYLCNRVLRPDGSLWIISGQEHGAEIDLSLQLEGLTVRNRITWHETFGVYCHGKFGRCSRPIFYAVKGKGFTFNREAVTVPSARQTKYGDRRAAPGGKIMSDVWQINRVCGTFRERVKGVPTQLPEELVRRIVGVSSNPGDTVLDPFAGSGTISSVSAALGRKAIGIELNPEYAAIAESRAAS